MPSPTSKKAHPGRRAIIFSLLLGWLVIVGLGLANRQAIMDWWVLRYYTPPPAIASLASEDTMTSYAKHLFYLNQPQLEDNIVFGSKCPNNGGEQTIVLGCYHSYEDGIYLLTVNDPRLNGVEQVTAAHETLHAAYDRLSKADKTKVDKLLEDYYHHDLKDPRLIQTIKAYQQTEPNDVVNEMHSVFGTEVANLPPSLESYYKRYFSDRRQIVSYADQYEAEFTSRQTQIAQDDAQLSQWKSEIDNLQNDLIAKQNALTAQQDSLMNLQKTNLNAYNAGVPAFNQAVDSYNTEVEQLKNLVASYNQLVTERNQIVFIVDQLDQELSTNQSTINH